MINPKPFCGPMIQSDASNSIRRDSNFSYELVRIYAEAKHADCLEYDAGTLVADQLK